MTDREFIKNWCQQTAYSDSNLFVVTLREKQLSDQQIKNVLESLDNICRHCFNGEVGCQCWNDEWLTGSGLKWIGWRLLRSDNRSWLWRHGNCWQGVLDGVLLPSPSLRTYRLYRHYAPRNRACYRFSSHGLLHRSSCKKTMVWIEWDKNWRVDRWQPGMVGLWFGIELKWTDWKWLKNEALLHARQPHVQTVIAWY